MYYLEIEGITYSCKLDEQIKSRSFQNINMTYKDVINEIMKGYGKYDYTFEATDKKIEKSIFQYKETDWEFIKRLSYDMGILVYCDIIKENNLFYFGNRKGNNYELKDNTYYKACKDLKRYYEVGGAKSNYHDTDFFYYEICRREKYLCGDNIDFKNKKLYVSEYKCVLDKCELIFKYKLCRKNGVWISKGFNSLLSGAIIEGEVLDVKDEKIKLHLDIDESQSKDEACWFNYAPETCNIMYSMPKIGARVGLYFPDEVASEPKVINALRKNRESNNKISDTSKRYLCAENNKSMEIFPDAISFKGSETGDLSISFDDNVGVKLSSPSNLSLSASEEIIIKTPETIEMNASNNIFLAKTNTRSGISIENEFHFLSDNVIQDGQDRETFSKYDDEPKEAEKPEKGFNWCALAIFAVAAVVAVAAIVLTGGILAAAIVGACVAVACTAVGDMITGEMSSFKDYFLSALSGAICGAIFGCLKIASIFGLMGVGALEGGLDSLIRQLGNGEFNLGTLLIDMGIGALCMGVFYNLGKVVRRIAPRAKNSLQNAIRKAMPRIKSGLNRVKEGAAIRVNALIRALRNNDVPITRGLGSNFGNLNPDYVRNLKKSYNEAKKDIAKGVSKADERLTSLTKEQLKGKPKNSPNPDKWFKKNGTISIDDKGSWTYHDWEGNSVSYPDGYPDFKSAGMVEQEVNIGPFQGYNKDFPLGDELAPNGPISESSTWHHHQDGVTLQEVLTKLHERFRHRGGMSKIKK